jgi:hypothetical protein
MKKMKYPLNIQLFAEPGEDGNGDEPGCYPAHSPHQSTANYLTSFKKLFLF